MDYNLRCDGARINVGSFAERLERNGKPFDASHLDDDTLLDRLRGPVLYSEDQAEIEPKPKPQRRKRKPSLISVAKQAERAGLEVARYDVDTDGKIGVVLGKPDGAPVINEHGNEWDRLQ